MHTCLDSPIRTLLASHLVFLLTSMLLNSIDMDEQSSLPLTVDSMLVLSKTDLLA
jgi:hypothetical protein